MSKYRLPDLGDTLNTYQTAKTENRRQETQENLDQWMQLPHLAQWARKWVVSLKEIYNESLPQFIYQGLGGSWHVPSWMEEGRPDPLWLRQYLGRSDTADAWYSQGYLQDDPIWLTRLLRLEQAKVARSFLLIGNVSDYAFDPVHGYRPASRLLVDSLLLSKDCVLSYRLSGGLTLHANNPGIEEKLPEEIRTELGNSGYHSDTPVISELCRIFDLINHWLSTPSTGCEETQVSTDLMNGVALIFENLHLLIPQQPGDMERNYLIDNLLNWSNSPELFRSNHCLILSADTLEDVSSELRARGGKIEQINVPRPEEASARLKFLLPSLDPQSNMRETRVARFPDGLAGLEGYNGTYVQRLNQLSHDTAGLTLMAIEDLLQEAIVGPTRILSRNTVMKLKRERLRQESEGVLEIVDPRISLKHIGGYSYLKKRLKEIISALRNPDNPLIQNTIPMGVLLVGPPGTGKSILAEALAGESNISMAKLGDFRGMYVGQSERNLSRIFSLIQSLHPVIVFIDEIDQALGKRGKSSGDGGVDNRIFGRFLEFMSDKSHRGKILWVGASNFPDDIDPAMKRAGRFDLVLPVLLPDLESRISILQVLLKKEIKDASGLKTNLSQDDIRFIGSETDGFSGAELSAVVGEVIRRTVHRLPQDLLAKDAPSKEINLNGFREVLNVYKPPPEQRKQYRDMELIAIKDVSFIDMLPPRHKEIRLAGTIAGQKE